MSPAIALQNHMQSGGPPQQPRITIHAKGFDNGCIWHGDWQQSGQFGTKKKPYHYACIATKSTNNISYIFNPITTKPGKSSHHHPCVEVPPGVINAKQIRKSRILIFKKMLRRPKSMLGNEIFFHAGTLKGPLLIEYQTAYDCFYNHP